MKAFLFIAVWELLWATVQCCDSGQRQSLYILINKQKEMSSKHTGGVNKCAQADDCSTVKHLLCSALTALLALCNTVALVRCSTPTFLLLFCSKQAATSNFFYRICICSHKKSIHWILKQKVVYQKIFAGSFILFVVVISKQLCKIGPISLLLSILLAVRCS